MRWKRTSKRMLTVNDRMSYTSLSTASEHLTQSLSSWPRMTSTAGQVDPVLGLLLHRSHYREQCRLY